MWDVNYYGTKCHGSPSGSGYYHPSLLCLEAVKNAHSFFCESFTEAKMRHHATWDKPYAALCSVRKAEAARGGETRLTEGDVCQVPVPLYCLNAVVVVLSIS